VLLIETDSRDAAERLRPAWEVLAARSVPTAAIVLSQVYDLALTYRPLYDASAAD
jgi:hypothetical protein